jgi:hypothetical protein
VDNVTVPVEVAERFTTAMKAWLPVMGFVFNEGYMHDTYVDRTVTCNFCGASSPYDDDGQWVSMEHAEDCRLAQVEQGLETLRKMATGVE